jgi:hypothetical protein
MHGKNASQKVRDAYIFPMPRIIQAAEDARNLAKAIKEFYETANFLPFANHAPAF